MTATVTRLRRPSAGACNSGTVPGQVTAPCGRSDTKLYHCGPRCPDHFPRPRKATA